MARPAFVLATALCLTLGGWGAVAVVAAGRVGAHWSSREVTT